MAKLETLTDTFDLEIDSVKWPDKSPEVTWHPPDGMAKFPFKTTPGYVMGGLWSNPACVYDLTNSYIYARMIHPGFMGTGLTFTLSVIVAQSALNNRLDLGVTYDNQIGDCWTQARRQVNGTYTTVRQTYTAQQQMWLRIRESAGTIYWDTGTDGINWTNFTTFANPFAITSVIARFSTLLTMGTNPYYCLVDCINTPLRPKSVHIT